jgi:membrane fusion protein, heavy metal efflux system
MRYSLRWILFTMLFAGLIITSSCTAAPEAPAKEAPAVVEETAEGSKTKRVKLTEKAAARLGIKVDVVKESVVTRTRVVGGTVVDIASLISESEFIPVTGSQGYYVSVRLSKSDLTMLDKEQPAQVSAGSVAGIDLLAEPVGYEKALNGVNVPLYFMVHGTGANLSIGQTVVVKYFLSGSGTTKRSVPYSAILYDLKGDTWLYTSPSPLVFTRQPVVIDYIDADQVILLDGPPAGAQIVTVGVPELFGIDTGVDK